MKCPRPSIWLIMGTHTNVQTDWDDVKSSVTPLGLVAPVPRVINSHIKLLMSLSVFMKDYSAHLIY